MEAYSIARTAANDGRTFRIGYRLFQLQKLFNLLSEHKEEILTAVSKDSGVDKKFVEHSGLLPAMQAVVDSSNRLWTRYKRKGEKHLELAGTLQTAAIIGHESDPLASLFIPVAAAIEAGATAVMILPPQAQAAAATLGNLLPKYLDREAYALLKVDPRTLQNIPFDTVVSTGRRVGESSENKRVITCDVGLNVVCILDKNVDFKTAASEIARVRKSGGAKSLFAPHVVLCLGELFGGFKDAATMSGLTVHAPFSGEKSVSFAQKQTVLAGSFSVNSASAITLVSVTSTEEALLLFQNLDINRLVYFGRQDYGEYMLKFSPRIYAGFVNTISDRSCFDISPAVFSRPSSDRVHIARTLKPSSVSDREVAKAFRALRMPNFQVKYGRSMGFFDQGFLISFGAIISTVLLTVGFGGYKAVAWWKAR